MSGQNGDCETRACLLTAPSRGAIAVIAVAGPAAVAAVDGHFRAANGRELSQQPISTIVYGHWGDMQGEDLVVCRRAEQEVEVQCHGGSQSIDRVLSQLIASGCEVVDWHEWIAQRSQCAIRAEASTALANAMTLRTATILLEQYYGTLRREIEAVQQSLGKKSLAKTCERIDAMLCWSEFGLHLTNPWQVVIAGRPNVGKSSLINALVGYERAIVVDQPGTTRDVVTAITAFEGWPVQLSDTAGLRSASDELELSGIALAKDRLRRADLVVWLLDATAVTAKKISTVEELVALQTQELEIELDLSRTIVVLNKIDLAPPPASLSGNFFSLSAISGAGLDKLVAEVAERLVPQVPHSSAAIPFSPRQVALLGEARNCFLREETSAGEKLLIQLLNCDN